MSVAELPDEQQSWATRWDYSATYREELRDSDGALEAAPQFHVLVSSVESPEASASIQRRLVRDFPNVAIIDLKFVMQTIDDILGEITFIIRFMAMLSILRRSRYCAPTSSEKRLT